MSSVPITALALLSAVEETGLRSVEFDWPQSGWGWALWVGGAAVVLLLTVVLALKDTAGMSRAWAGWLAVLRIGVIAALLVIALNPQERTQKIAHRPSRVAILVDTSLSMRHPEAPPAEGAESPGSRPTRSRAAAVQALLESSPLVDQLRSRHEVSIYTFDQAVAGPHHVYPQSEGTGAGTVRLNVANGPSWAELLEPRGLETRLGESLVDLIRQIGGRTLSGVVVISDGASNAGIDPSTAHDRALSSKTRLVTVGVGGTEQPINVQMADLQSPTEVQMGDAYDVSAFVQAQGLEGRTVEVELLMQPEGSDGEPTVVERRQVTLLEDGIAAEVAFRREPQDAGAVRYTVRAQPLAGVQELNDQDNEQTVTVTAFDRPTRVLLVAGGPMRDYQFVRNLLYRHPSIEVDVLLQTGTVGVSQEAHELLLEFPEKREDLFTYDVIVAFDPDWTQIPEAGREMLAQWVANEAGGLILVAGDIHTPRLATATEPLESIRALYPVSLSPVLMEFQLENDASQPWPVNFTDDGEGAGFLQLTEDGAAVAAAWKDFAGMYRAFPTSGAKAGATVYAHFSDPRSQNEHGFPVLLASQFYGQGRTMYLGSAEIWRLRALDDRYYDRFWIKSIREVGQGRTKRGTRRGLLLLERKRNLLGQTVRVRARLLDPQFQPLSASSVALDVYDPNGRPLVPSRTLTPDPNRPGEFVGDFRASLPGTYKLELPVPDSTEELTEEVLVALPKLEDENVRQNVKALSELSQDTGGTYLSLAEVPQQLAELLPNRGEEFLVDERLRTLWDRQWVMFLLVGLLSVEWLTRKLLKLA